MPAVVSSDAAAFFRSVKKNQNGHPRPGAPRAAEACAEAGSLSGGGEPPAR